MPHAEPRIKPLSGYRIIGFEHAWAAPFGTMMLADMGADLVKIEMPGTGDHVRKWTRNDLFGLSPHFLSVNRNKRSLAIDLKSPQGRALALSLIAKADALVENFSPGTMDDLGLGYAECSAVNPRLVWCSVNGFGSDGPYSHFRAYDFLIQAEGGILSVTGKGAGDLAKVGVPIVDIATAMVAAFTTVCGLMERDRTGRGRRHEIPMLDVSASLMSFTFFAYLLSGHMDAPLGTAHPLLAPYQAYSTSTGQVAIAVLTEAHWAKFCDFIGRPDLTDRPEYRIAPMRVENRESLNREIQPIFLTRPAEYWVAELSRLGLACCQVNDVAALLDHPQLRHRGFFSDWVIDGHKLRAPGAPWNPAGPDDRDALPPAIGEHTDAILSDWLALSPQRIAELRTASVVEG